MASGDWGERRTIRTSEPCKRRLVQSRYSAVYLSCFFFFEKYKTCFEFIFDRFSYDYDVRSIDNVVQGYFYYIQCTCGRFDLSSLIGLGNWLLGRFENKVVS